MSYLARLKAEVSEKGLPSEPTKPTKAPSVSFVIAQGRHILGIGEGAPRPEAEADALLDPAAEARRRRVLAMLAERPGSRYALITDDAAEPEAVIVAVAIRDVGSCELCIPRQKWDPLLFLESVERHSVH